MAADFSFVFRNSQRDRFRSGKLVREWRARYPQLFDEHDELVLLSRHQRRYHFCEWLAAVLLFEATGYLSLVVKYTAKSHASKHEPLRGALPESVADWVFANETGQPDLFVYSPDRGDWFFCEVKGPGDRMSAKQVQWQSDFQTLLDEQIGSSAKRYRLFRLDVVDD